MLARGFATCCDESFYNFYDDYGNLSFLRITDGDTTPEIYNVFPEISMTQNIANTLGSLNVRHLDTDELYQSNSEVGFDVVEDAVLGEGFSINIGVDLEISMNACTYELGN